MTWLDDLEKRAKNACEGETQYFVELYGDEVLRLVRGYRTALEALEFYGQRNAWVREGIDGLGLQSRPRSIHESDVDEFGGKRAREALSLAREMGEKHD